MMSEPMFHPESPSDEPVDSGSGLPIPSMGHVESEQEDDSLADGVDSAIRKEAISAPKPEGPPGYVFSRISVALLMLVWIATGLSKVLDVSGFVDVVNQHRVIPEDLKSMLVWVGPGEIVMGLLLVFAIGSELRKLFGKFVLLISLAATGGLIYYISLVDPVVLQESGCGCLSDFRIASGIEGMARFFDYGILVIMAILHLVALFGPAMVDGRRRLG